MYQPAPTADELRMTGLTMDEAMPSVDIWPDNWRTVMLFDAIGTQWRVGMGGPVGIDYNVMFHKLDRLNLPPSEYEEIESGVRVMEEAALAIMRKRNG